MSAPTDPIAYLRRLLNAGSHNDVVQMIRDRDSVIHRFGPVFSDPDRLTEESLADFLLFENNRHWWGLQRRTPVLTRHIAAIRAMIGELLDEDRPLPERIDALGEPAEFDHDIWSPILLVTHPDEYGVWNGISESAMRRLGLWPDGMAGASTGETYVRVNEMVNLVKEEVGTDLWTLDALWWGAEKEHDPTRHFTTRRAPRHAAPTRSAPAHTKTLRAAKAKTIVAADTFVCQNCWTTKPTRLESEDRPGHCVDCS